MQTAVLKHESGRFFISTPCCAHGTYMKLGELYTYRKCPVCKVTYSVNIDPFTETATWEEL